MEHEGGKSQSTLGVAVTVNTKAEGSNCSIEGRNKQVNTDQENQSQHKSVSTEVYKY